MTRRLRSRGAAIALVILIGTTFAPFTLAASILPVSGNSAGATTLAQAMITNNVDFGVITYGLSETLYPQGFRSLVDAGDLSVPYQGPEICGLKESVAGRNEFYLRVAKALAESVAYILDDNNKAEVTKVLQRNLRLSRNEVIEGSYKVLRKMTTLDMAPNVAAFKSVQRIVARINPKITQVDLDQIIDTSFVRNLESSGFLPELRKKIR